jgi:hypothetical protein
LIRQRRRAKRASRGGAIYRRAKIFRLNDQLYIEKSTIFGILKCITDEKLNYQVLRGMRPSSIPRESPISAPTTSNSILVLVSAAIFTAYFVGFYSQTLEDAHITARYALRLWEGYPYGTWNRDLNYLVEGSTSTVWPYLMALARSKEALLDVAKVAAAGSYLCVLLVMWRASINGPLSSLLISKRSPLLAVIACGVYLPFGWYAASGMETVFFASLVALVAFLPLTRFDARTLHLTLCCLLCLTRPEGMLIAIGISGFCALFDSRRVWVFGGVLLFTVLISFARYRYFGYWLPNTVYSKSGEGLLYVGFGFSYVKTYLAAHFIFILVIGAAFLNWKKLTALHVAIASGLAVFTVLLVKAGGDNPFAFPFWRHFVHLLPLIAFLLFECLATLRWRVELLNIALLVTLFAAPYFFRPDGHGSGDLIRKEFLSRAPSPVADWISFLEKITDEQTVIASEWAGQIPFYVDAVHIDTVGLNDVHIAHFGKFDPGGPIDTKSDMAYVFGRRPDVLVATFSASHYSTGKFDTLTSFKWRGQLVRTTLCDPRFMDYIFVENGPYRGFDRAFFLSSSFVENSTKLDGYDLRPVRTNAPLTTFLAGYCRTAGPIETNQTKKRQGSG